FMTNVTAQRRSNLLTAHSSRASDGNVQNIAKRVQRLILFIILADLGCINRPSSPPASEPASATDSASWFRDITADSGLHHIYHNGEDAGHLTILEALGGGVAVFDYNGYGLPDIFVTGGGYFDGKEIRGHPSRLFQNLGNGKFRDVTVDVGL